MAPRKGGAPNFHFFDEVCFIDRNKYIAYKLERGPTVFTMEHGELRDLAEIACISIDKLSSEYWRIQDEQKSSMPAMGRK